MIFISHSTNDKEAALTLQQKFLDRHYVASQVFLDSDAESGIPAGSKWEEELYARLKGCRALVVLCSKNWQNSKWCFAELVYAKAAGKEIFPVLIEECAFDQVTAEHQAVFVHKDGEQAYERLFNALTNRHLGPVDDFGWPTADGDWCPYPGLPAFDERLAGVYFGREDETNALLDDLRKMRRNGEPRFLMIVGGSGSGKSSLLKGGVLPRIKHKTADTEWIALPSLRYGERANEQETIFDQLAVNVAGAFPKEFKPAPDWRSIRDRLFQDDPQGAAKDFLDDLQDLRLARGRSDATVLIAIDQFEELLAPAAGPLAAKFLRLTRHLFGCSNGRLLGIGTMRSDHLDIYERNSASLSVPYLRSTRLGPFPSDRLEDVIRKPAARAGVTVTDALVKRLIERTPTIEALPLLAFTLEKLYRKLNGARELNLQHYVDIGGIEGSIQTCIKGLMPPIGLSEKEERELRLSFVKYLAQVNEKGDVIRQSARWGDLPDAAKPILEKFVSARLLVRSKIEASDKNVSKDKARVGGATKDPRWVTVEVAHEAMFRCWDDLARWLNTSVGIMRWRRDVQRDRENDNKWSRLRPAQLAIARRWLQRRRDELTDEEVKWIKKASFGNEFDLS